MTRLTVEDVVTSYGQIEALKGVSLSVAAGEIVAIIGANGAGKTTLLLSISGVLAPSRGTIRLDGEQISGLPAHVIARRGIAQVVEGRGILHTLSVADNLKLGAYRRRDRDAIAHDIDAMYERFPRLAERRFVLAGALSGGEQQMLAIARGLLARPRLLLLDEPSMGLAPLLVDAVFRLVADIGAAGTTILLVEQNAARALDIAHRAYVMASGRIVAQGKAADLLEDPAVRDAYLGLTPRASTLFPPA